MRRERIIKAGAQHGAQIARGAAEAGKVVGQTKDITLCRIDPAVAPVVNELLTDRGGDRAAFLCADETRRIRVDVVDRIAPPRIAQRLAPTLVDLRSEEPTSELQSQMRI